MLYRIQWSDPVKKKEDFMFFARILKFIFRALSFDFCCRFLAVSAVIFIWDSLVSTRPEADNSRKEIADRAILKISNALRRNRGNLKYVSVMHFKNDSSDYVTFNLRKKLGSAGVFDVKEAGLIEKVNYMLKRRNKGSYDIKRAVKHGKSAEVQAVIIGNIDRFESINNGALIKGTVRLISIPDGRIITEIPVNESTLLGVFTESDFSEGSSEMVPVPWHIRFLVFTMTVLLLPVISIAFIRFMVAKRSNSCNVFVLSVYTVVDMLLAWFLCGGFVNALSVVIFLTASILAFIYNLSVMSFALKLES